MVEILKHLRIKTKTKLGRILRKNSEHARVSKMIIIIGKVVAKRETFLFAGGAMSREKPI